MFSHIKPIKVTNDFKSRIILSSAGYIRLMPLGGIDGDSTSYFANIASEAALIFEIKKLMDDKAIQNTCKEYIKLYEDHGSCIIDIQKDIYSHYQFSTTGNILLVATGALGTFNVKKLISEQYGKKNHYVLIKSVNDIIETSILSAVRTKSLILSKNSPIQYSMGHELLPSSILGTIERQVSYKYLVTAIGQVRNLIASVDKKTFAKREISSVTRPKLKREKLRFKELKNQFFSFQENGFQIQELKEGQKKMASEIEVKLEQLKEESFIFKVAAFFDSSLYQLTAGDLISDDGPEKKML